MNDFPRRYKRPIWMGWWANFIVIVVLFTICVKWVPYYRIAVFAPVYWAWMIFCMKVDAKRQRAFYRSYK